jgi:hypothetical protein
MIYCSNRRHARFLTRLQSLTANPTTAVPVIKAATRGYRLAETTARDLILTIWNVMDQKLEHTASIVNAFVDLVDEEEKKQDILASWKSFEIEVCRSLFFYLLYIYGADLILVLATTTIPRPRPFIIRIGVCWDHIWSCFEGQAHLNFTFIFTILAASLESCRFSS